MLNTTIAYLTLYVLFMIYFTVLGCFMIFRQDNQTDTHIEIAAKKRMTRSVGIYMFFMVFDYIIYLPPILKYGQLSTNPCYDLCFILTQMTATPMLYIVVNAVVQRRINIVRLIGYTGTPFLLLFTLYATMPYGLYGRLPVHLSAALSVAYVTYLLISHVKEYRIYIHRMYSEYSETTNRDIIWSWSCFTGFAIQTVVFIVYSYYWTQLTELIYGGISIVNAAYLCYCICKQKPLNLNIAKEDPIPDETEENNDDKAFYPIIEQKLNSLCEEKLLYLNPDLTREDLCKHLSISSTYLKMYFHSHGLTFYQYINTLRVEYANKLMEENPDMPIAEISELSGFRSQTTFRKMFKEIMGCLPSEVRKKEQ